MDLCECQVGECTVLPGDLMPGGAARLTSSATDASQLRGHGYGTRCQSI